MEIPLRAVTSSEGCYHAYSKIQGNKGRTIGELIGQDHWALGKIILLQYRLMREGQRALLESSHQGRRTAEGYGFLIPKGQTCICGRIDLKDL